MIELVNKKVDEVINSVNLNETSDVLLKDIQKLENLCNRLEVRTSKINQLTSNSNENEITEAWNYFFKDFDFKKTNVRKKILKIILI